MKLTVLIIFAVAFLGGCGQRVSSPSGEVQAPDFAPPVKRASAVASAATHPAAIDEPAGHSTPDYKDSAGNLGSSR
jgi:hypothetical protein